MRYCSEFKLHLFSVVFLLVSFHATAQRPIITSFETELDYAFGGGAYGITGIANHQWTKKEKLNFQSGISMALFLESNAQTTSLYTRKGILFDPHLNATSGISCNLLKNKFHIGLNLFAGLYLLRRQGRYSSTVIHFTQDKYLYQATYFNWGARATLGYNLNERIAIQLSTNNSFNDWLFFHGTDHSKMFFGIGVIFYSKPGE